MRIDPAVKKETLYILGASIILSVVMELVFWLVGHMDYTVPLGNLLGVIIAVLNFFLMGLTIQRSIGLDEKAASDKLKLSQMLRMLMVLALAAVGVAVSCFHALAVVIPLFFPRIAIAFRPLLDKDLKQQPTDDQTLD
ncbi:MAG: ATP synthase subunit I [Clostridiales bacterium]|nr:ATP synthase subunit I [Clostridiales bacterium]